MEFQQPINDIIKNIKFELNFSREPDYMKREIRSLSLNEIEEYILGIGEKKFRAKQLFGWISKGIENFDDGIKSPFEIERKT